MKSFKVGGHEVRVWRHLGRWGVSVDGRPNRGWFLSEARAAGAGLLRAQFLDRRPGQGAGAGGARIAAAPVRP